METLPEKFGILHYARDYFETVRVLLGELGFTRENTIAGVVACRDELCFSLLEVIKEHWGNPFVLSGLAGFHVAGRTALKAMIAHAPTEEPVERYLFFVFSHMGFDGEREGLCKRQGRREISSACGALLTILEELKAGRLDLTPDPKDWELSILKFRLLKEIPYGYLPDLWGLTKMTVAIGVRELEAQLADLVDASRANYAIVSGIQLHTPEGDFISPSESFAFIEGKRVEIPVMIKGQQGAESLRS